MWETQTLFRVSAKLAAEGIFNTLDRGLTPDIFLLGFANTPDKEPKIMMEPETTPFPAELFAGIKQLAGQLKIQDENRPESETFIFDEGTHKRLIRQRYLAKAIEYSLNNFKKSESGHVFFSSLPSPINGYLVFVVLQFNKKTYDSHYTLKRAPATTSDNPSSGSLLDATVAEFLRDCQKALKELESEPDSGMHIIDRDYNEILRAAGKQFMYTPANGIHGLFDACNAIASMRYELAEGIGGMLVARQGHRNVESILTLETPVPLREYRTVRKLLEVSGQGIHLLTDSVYIYGFGRVKGEYNPQDEDLYSICFTNYYTWQLEHAGHVMMKVIFGLPSLAKSEIDKEVFSQEVRRIFKQLTNEAFELLWDFTEEVMYQQKGTIMVISEGAEAEAERLSKQAFKIKPFKISTSMLRLVTNIDGAVLLSPDGSCHAIGVILDGLASERGEPSRGSRFNSALRYSESSPYLCLAVVVSEDGIVDLISPNYRLSSVKSRLGK